jgi:hypothetical protein
MKEKVFQRILQHYNWESIAAKYAALFNEIAQKGPGVK